MVSLPYDTRDDLVWVYLALNCAGLPRYDESISCVDCREAAPPDYPHGRHVQGCCRSWLMDVREIGNQSNTESSSLLEVEAGGE